MEVREEVKTGLPEKASGKLAQVSKRTGQAAQNLAELTREAGEKTQEQLAKVRENLQKARKGVTRKAVVHTAAMAIRVAAGPGDEIGAAVISSVAGKTPGGEEQYALMHPVYKNPDESTNQQTQKAGAEPPKDDNSALIVGKDGKPVGRIRNGKLEPIS